MRFLPQCIWGYHSLTQVNAYTMPPFPAAKDRCGASHGRRSRGECTGETKGMLPPNFQHFLSPRHNRGRRQHGKCSKCTQLPKQRHQTHQQPKSEEVPEKFEVCPQWSVVDTIKTAVFMVGFMVKVSFGHPHSRKLQSRPGTKRYAVVTSR